MSTSFDTFGQQQAMAQQQHNLLAQQQQQWIVGGPGGSGGLSQSGSCSYCGQYYWGFHSCPQSLGTLPQWQGATSTSIPKSDTIPKKEKKMSMVKEYMNKHRDIIFTLVGAMLVDHFLLHGALRKRIQAVVEAILFKVEKALGLPAGEKQEDYWTGVTRPKHEG